MGGSRTRTGLTGIIGLLWADLEHGAGWGRGVKHILCAVLKQEQGGIASEIHFAGVNKVGCFGARPVTVEFA